MSVIEDLSAAIDNYPEEKVRIQIFEFKEPGTHINIGETCTFRVQVTNFGNLDMKNLRLHIRGSNFSSVSDNGLNFSSSFDTERRDVAAHSARTFSRYFMKATSATGSGGTASEELLRAHVKTFDASLHHILNDHSHHTFEPEGAYSRHIHPN